MATRTVIEHTTAPVGQWRVGQLAASSAKHVEGGSDATAPAKCWNLANFEQNLFKEAASDKHILHDRKAIQARQMSYESTIQQVQGT